MKDVRDLQAWLTSDERNKLREDAAKAIYGEHLALFVDGLAVGLDSLQVVASMVPPNKATRLARQLLDEHLARWESKLVGVKPR